MARAILYLMLIGTTVFGPSFCCCSLGWVASPIAGEGSGGRQPCCCVPDPGAAPAPPRHDDSRRDCPCKKCGKVVSALLSDGASGLQQQADSRWTPAPDFHLGTPHLSAAVRVATSLGGCPSCAFPYLTGRGVLLQLHILRC